MRKTSNSITHLVKIVAAEVFDEKMEERNQKFYTRELRFCTDIKSSVEKAGQLWTEDEDDLLIQEVRTAVDQIAQNHHRSVGAIGSRINQKELIRSS